MKTKLMNKVESDFKAMLLEQHRCQDVHSMIEEHKKILGENAIAGQFKKKVFDRKEHIANLKKEGWTDYEIGILMKSPKMRIKEAAEAKEIEHQTRVIKKYVESYCKTAQKMTKEYKRQAINQALIDMYCDESHRYLGKNRELIEKAQFADQEWRRIKTIYDEQIQDSLDRLKGQHLPGEINKSISDIYDYYKKYSDQQDVDSKTVERMAMLNKSSGIRLNSTFVIEQARKEEAELNKLVTEDKKVREDLMYTVAPGQMIKSLKKNSNSYEAS